METDELIYFAMWHTRCEVLRHCTRESCIVSGRLFSQVLTEMGITPIPVTVGVTALNAEAWKKYQHGIEFDARDPDEPGFGIRLNFKPGGTPEGSDDWPGHLAIVANNMLCDPSIDQLSRPEHGLVTLPTTYKFQSSDSLEEWLNGGEEALTPLPMGGVISYEAHLEELSYQDSPDWGMVKEGDPLHRSVMEKTLGLIDLFRDVEGLPALPPLPPAPQASDGATPELIARDARSKAELGVTREQLEAYEAFDRERRALRQTERAAGEAARLFR